MAPYSSTLAWKIPWMEEPGRLQSMGSRRVGHDWATSLPLSCIGEGNGNPLQCSCLENPRDWEPGGLSSVGSHRVGHDWSDLAAAGSLYVSLTSRSSSYLSTCFIFFKSLFFVYALTTLTYLFKYCIHFFSESDNFGTHRSDSFVHYFCCLLLMVARCLTCSVNFQITCSWLFCGAPLRPELNLH